MGKHHGRHRPGPPAARRAALRRDLPAVDQKRRHARWARPSRARSGSRRRRPAPTTSINTGSTWTTPTWASACGSSPTWAAGDRGRYWPSRRPMRGVARPSGAWRHLTRRVHEDGGWRGAAGHGNLLRRGNRRAVGLPARGHLRRRPQQRASPSQVLGGEGLAVIDAFVEPGLAKSKGEARRLVTPGGAYANNRRVDQVDVRLRRKTWRARRRSFCGPEERTMILRFVDDHA